MARGGVDPTGYVKGWAAQRALAALVFPGVVGAVVNAAGDIASFGSTGDGEPLRFGVVEPGQLHKLAFVVAHSGAVATSGTYERGAHLYDPGNGEAACRVASATVTGAELGMTDALAAALAVGGETVLALVEAAEGFEGMLIGADGARQATSGFPYAGDQ
jgi:thiamine biosynthesis lipoprotein